MKVTGQLLKEAREAKGYSLNEVAMGLKINTKIVRAIEENDQENLPPKTFLRGFVQSYAKFLKIDHKEIVSTFQDEMGSTKPKPAIQDQLNQESERKKLAEQSSEGDRKPWVFRVGWVAAIFVVFMMVFAVIQKLEKYEDEKLAAPLPEKLSSIEQNAPIENDAKAENSAGDINDEIESDLNTAPKVVTTIKIEPKGYEEPEKNAAEDTTVSGDGPEAVAATLDSNTETENRKTAENSGADGEAERNDLAQKETPAGTLNSSQQAAFTPPETPTPLLAFSGLELEEAQKAFGVEDELKKAKEESERLAKKAEEEARAEAKRKAELKKAEEKRLAEEKAAKERAEAKRLAEIKKKEEEEKKKAVANMPANPQEVIVEAFDKVKLSVTLDDGSLEKFTMGEDEIRVLKGKRRITISVSDAGSVNIIHNGRDIGVPGSLGTAMNLKFPR